MTNKDYRRSPIQTNILKERKLCHKGQRGKNKGSPVQWKGKQRVREGGLPPSIDCQPEEEGSKTADSSTQTKKHL